MGSGLNEVLDAVIDEVGGDRERVILTGVSSGRSGAWAVGSMHADRFAGVVPLCQITRTGLDSVERKPGVLRCITSFDTQPPHCGSVRFVSEFTANSILLRLHRMRDGEPVGEF